MHPSIHPVARSETRSALAAYRKKGEEAQNSGRRQRKISKLGVAMFRCLPPELWASAAGQVWGRRADVQQPSRRCRSLPGPVRSTLHAGAAPRFAVSRRHSHPTVCTRHCRACARARACTLQAPVVSAQQQQQQRGEERARYTRGRVHDDSRAEDQPNRIGAHPRAPLQSNRDSGEELAVAQHSVGADRGILAKAVY